MNLLSAGGGGISRKDYEATTATPADVLSGQTFYSKDKELKTGTLGKETKTVTPSTAKQTVTPSNGKLLSSVTVNAISTETKTAYPYNDSQTVAPSSGKYLAGVTIPAVRVKTGSVYISGANTTSSETTIDLGATYHILSVAGFGFRGSTGYATFIKEVKINNTTILSESRTSNGLVQWSATEGSGVTGRYIKFKGRTNGGGYIGYVGISVTYC